MKTFGWKRPVRDGNGDIVTTKPSPVKVRTLGSLGGSFGCDQDKRLVFTMLDEDLIQIRPERTSRAVHISAFDVYTYCLRCQANLAVLERARARKASKARRLANARQERAERRLFGK